MVGVLFVLVKPVRSALMLSFPILLRFTAAHCTRLRPAPHCTPLHPTTLELLTAPCRLRRGSLSTRILGAPLPSIQAESNSDTADGKKGRTPCITMRLWQLLRVGGCCAHVVCGMLCRMHRTSLRLRLRLRFSLSFKHLCLSLRQHRRRCPWSLNLQCTWDMGRNPLCFSSGTYCRRRGAPSILRCSDR